MTKNAVGTVFTERFEQITKEVPFSDKWNNGTGYYDHACELVNLKPGELAKSYDQNTSRRIILIGTRFGTVVLFDRYSKQTDGGTYVTNAPTNWVLKQFMSNSAVGEAEAYRLLGSWKPENNLGYTIEELAKELAAS